MTKDLFQLIDENNSVQTEAALLAGTIPEATNPEGQTPLLYALYKKNIPIALLLIRHGANVNAQDQVLNTPFLYAGAQGFTDVVAACLKAGADFTILNRYGGTALIPAAEKAHLETVKLLAGTPGFPIDHVNNLGWTALLEAIILGEGDETHSTVVATLIEAGCNVNIADKKGITPLTHARQLDYREIAALLEAAGAR
ncbi:ankyrin repeat domain-containing protein [Niabella beijingensis]|uniref:ankyrin repeat domain-containing protein n=1 Tax=Niabella beijingensis TaxID=2872700 RepID=UPI001CBF4FD0|nr:ankyrin repeat domain-containing protein [Niabella beijingensis]MBZ4190686.1 ankyrin repeat domain-containing protein [Niabella beijingensis]